MEMYIGVLLVGALAIGALLVSYGFALGNAWAVAALAVTAAVAERGSVRLGRYIEESISLLPTLLAAILFGPVAAMAVAAISMLGDLRGGPDRPLLKWGTYTCTRAITGAATGFVAMHAGGLVESRLGAIAIATTCATAVAEGLDLAFALTTYRIKMRLPLATPLRELAPAVAASLPIYTPVVALLAFAYQAVSPWMLLLFFAPALAAQRTFILYEGQKHLTSELLTANTRLERANLSFATALVATLDARDRYTAGHSAAVAIYARDIATRMGLSSDQQQLSHLCGLVHDIGKIGLPPGLLEKPGTLTLDERRQMQEHSAIGEHILAKVEDYAEIAAIVRHHHERVDGFGYPDELTLDEIPLLSRIIAVADAYNAMTSDRPYRDAMPSRVARLRLAQAVETQFDTTVVAAFEAILAGASETYRSAAGTDFTLKAQDVLPRNSIARAI